MLSDKRQGISRIVQRWQQLPPGEIRSRTYRGVDMEKPETWQEEAVSRRQTGGLKRTSTVLLLVAAMFFSVFAISHEAEAVGGNCWAWEYNSSSWGISTEGAKAQCSSLNSDTKFRAHHHNWGRDGYSSWSTATWTTKTSHHSIRSGWAGADLNPR